MQFVNSRVLDVLPSDKETTWQMLIYKDPRFMQDLVGAIGLPTSNQKECELAFEMLLDPEALSAADKTADTVYSMLTTLSASITWSNLEKQELENGVFKFNYHFVFDTPVLKEYRVEVLGNLGPLVIALSSFLSATERLMSNK